MTYTFEHIAKLTGARIQQQPAEESLITHVLTDSRQLTSPGQGIFCAVIGDRHDGHNYLKQVYERGVRNFLICKQMDLSEFPNAGVLMVEDSLEALQKLATGHRLQFDIPCIGITGSNGKTIIKEWLYQLLHEDKQVVRSPRSYNSQIGVPLSVLQIEPRHELAIFEAGISTIGEMENLQPIIQPNIGIFTNIGQAHAEGFRDIHEKIREKLKLFQDSDLIIYCTDHERIDEAIRNQFPEHNTFTWSKERLADLHILEINKGNRSTEIIGKLKEYNDKISIQIPLTDDASVENAIHCWSYMLVQGYAPSYISKRMDYLEPVAMRLELKEGINDCLLINDSYNSDLKSLSIALDFLDLQQGHAGKTLILSDILQTRESPNQLYKRVATLLTERNLKRFIGIGEDIGVIKSWLTESIETHFYPNTTAFFRDNWQKKFKNEIILIKGARPFTFEKISDAFSRQVHSARLEIDLNALVHNLNVYRNYLREETGLMVMVKAFAYGAGIEVAKILEFNKVDQLAVANADEGLQLRQAGIRMPIMILNADPTSINIMLNERLEPEIFSIEQLKSLLDLLSGPPRQIPVHIRCDSGMNRLGFTKKDLPVLAELLQSNSQLNVRSVFSHLASSEMPEHDDYSNAQTEYFTTFANRLQELTGHSFSRHLVNTAGIHRFPQFHFDMVRLGLGLYGVDPSGEIQSQLRSVLRWVASIQQIKQLNQKDTVGYNRRGRIQDNTRIATINVGYADGLPRLAGNGKATVLIQGKKAPTVGNICMDMSMVDITDIPNAAEGDEVVIFGLEHPVDQLAEAAQTIPYEIFSRIPPRIRRVYFQE